MGLHDTSHLLHVGRVQLCSQQKSTALPDKQTYADALTQLTRTRMTAPAHKHALACTHICHRSRLPSKAVKCCAPVSATAPEDARTV